MAYEQHADGTLTLFRRRTSTRAWAERGAAILQDVMSVYETDGYQRMMEWMPPSPAWPTETRRQRRRRTASSPTMVAA